MVQLKLEWLSCRQPGGSALLPGDGSLGGGGGGGALDNDGDNVDRDSDGIYRTFLLLILFRSS